MSKKTKPSITTFAKIRSINLDIGLPSTAIDAIIEMIEAENDVLFARWLAAFSDLEMQSKMSENKLH